MAVFILKPTERDGNEFTGPVMTFEDTNSPTDIINEFISSGHVNVTVPNAGVPEDVLSSLDWYNEGYTGSSLGYGFFLAEVSGVGTSGLTTPTIANVNSSELITEVLHSNHSNTANGLAYNTTGTANYHYNSSALTISTANEVISLNYASNGQTTFAPNTKSRTLNNDNGNVYVNGILYASQTAGSGNESYVDWNSYSSLATYSSESGAKDQLHNNVSGNETEYIQAILKSLEKNNPIRRITTDLKNNNIIT